MPEPDLRRLLRRQLAILKYVEFRFRPQVRVSDEEVRKAWEEEQAGRPAGPALEDEQEAIRARLERRALDERIEAWVRELRARADVRYVGGPPAAPAGAVGPAQRARGGCGRGRRRRRLPRRGSTRVAASFRQTTGTSAIRRPRRRAT